MHVLEFSEGWYFPTEHGAQVADPVDDEVPAGHVVHAAAPTVVLDLVPALHGIQKTVSGAGWWKPPGHW